MKKLRTQRGHLPRHSLSISLLLIPLVLSGRAIAQNQETSVEAPARLSEWLLSHPATEHDYLLGLSWRVPGEQPQQQALHTHLLRELDALKEDEQINASLLRSLRSLIATLPVTGRVPVSMTDVRWLQAHPARDPVLQAGHRVVVPSRPATVTVLGATSQPCQVTHQALRRVMDYVNACTTGNASSADWVWVVQPDGRVQRFGVALWNLTPQQDEPAPGAWIWAPSRQEAWPEVASAHLVEFLATVGPASDGMGKPAVAANPIYMPDEPRSMAITTNDWGGVGLLQMPAARMRNEGEVTTNLTRNAPYTLLNVFLQPFDWMEAGFRYTALSNHVYFTHGTNGARVIPGMSFKDKSLDLKLRLMGESAYLPELAVGWRDLVGTGLFSGEYLVASKRTGDFDWNLGLGWGYVGHRGDLNNPLGYFSPAMKTRPPTNIGQGGKFSLNNYFRGPAAMFGGVQYQTPWSPLILKLEYDGNNYKNEPLGGVLRQSSPFNFGAVYRVVSGIDVMVGIERGNTAMLGLTFSGPLSRTYMPKFMDPPMVGVSSTRPNQVPDWAVAARDFSQQSGWSVSKIAQKDHDLRVTVADAGGGYWHQRTERAVAALHKDAPASVENFTITHQNHGMVVAEHHVDRKAWVTQHTQALSPDEQQNPLMTETPIPGGQAELLFRGARPAFEHSLSPAFELNLAGPDGPLYRLGVADSAVWRLGDSTWLEGGLNLRLFDNYNNYRFTAASNLPRVRTNIREFTVSSSVTMPRLQMAHTDQLSENSFVSMYGGFLEEMYAGVGGEWLYRPFESPFAFGVDINAVRKRGFKQDFSLQSYQTATGHASLYWDTGWNNIQANLSAGRYLAKDVGVSFELKRYFDNGVSMGAGLTKTNVSDVQFGEGSFDKWISLSIPLDAILPRSSDPIASMNYRPLIRDGGAKLHRSVALYDLTRGRDERTMRYTPAPQPNENLLPADRREAWTPPPHGIQPYTRTAPQVSVNQWTAVDQPYAWSLKEALYRQKFRDIDTNVDADARLTMRLSNDYLRPASRAVGRAARTALLSAPKETKNIHITLLERNSILSTDPEAVVEYEFSDLERLRQYFEGNVSESSLASTVKVRYLNSDAHERNPLALLNDETPILDKPSRFQEAAAPVIRIKDDLVNGFHHAGDIDWTQTAFLGGGLVLASSLLDKSADRYVARHAQSSVLKSLNGLGNTLVPLTVGAGAVFSALSDDPLLSRTGYTAVEAGGTALALSLGAKFAVGRARPLAGQGPNSFHAFAGSAKNRTDGFPSGHSMITWAVVTPFAQTYDAPWLYGVAGLTNLARVGSRNHWVSDTVAGSVLGYGIGKILWESSNNPSSRYPGIAVSGREITLSWNLP